MYCRCAVKAAQDASDASVIIYVREGVSAEQLVEDAQARFNIHLGKPIQVRKHVQSWGA